MNNVITLDKGFRTLCELMLNSKLPSVKPIAKRYGLITGSGVIKHVNKVYENGTRHNVLRMYAPTCNGLEPWFDMNYRFHTYVSDKNEQRLVNRNELVISWINLEDIYIELFIELAPTIETKTNTTILIEDSNELLEWLSDEAEYFYIRSMELKKQDDVPSNSLEAPPKHDSFAYVDKICSMMNGEE